MTQFNHHQQRLNGLGYHFVTAGRGPAILFLHGFPDLWLGWRPVMSAFVEAGYQVIAPDLRGFGDTEAATGSESATAVDVLGDLVALLDHLGIESVGLMAHDWGAEVGWTAVRLRPDRFRAIVSLSVPYAPRGEMSLPQILQKTAPPDLYMLYFMEEGIAEAELDADPKTFLRRLFHTNSGCWQGQGVPPMRLGESGRLIDGLDEPDGAFSVMSEEDLDLYASTFTRTGFRGALNTYRSLHRNWELLAGWADCKVEVPALYIGAERDVVLSFPGMSDLIENMPQLVPRCAEPIILKGAGHFIQMELPEEVANLGIDFFNEHILD